MNATTTTNLKTALFIEKYGSQNPKIHRGDMVVLNRIAIVEVELLCGTLYEFSFIEQRWVRFDMDRAYGAAAKFLTLGILEIQKNKVVFTQHGRRWYTRQAIDKAETAPPKATTSNWWAIWLRREGIHIIHQNQQQRQAA